MQICTLYSQMVEGAIKVYKGTNPEVDSYSVFWDNKKLTDTSLSTQLRMRHATDIYICGLAYDVCVGKQTVVKRTFSARPAVCIIISIVKLYR